MGRNKSSYKPFDLPGVSANLICVLIISSFQVYKYFCFVLHGQTAIPSFMPCENIACKLHSLLQNLP